MKIAIGYPPFAGIKKIAFLAQNRQFQWAADPWTAYPVVPASAATLLKQAGHEVYWLDGIATGQTYFQWERGLKKTSPDILMMETKTPVVKRHWEIIKRLKDECPELKIILVGDHVTALPEESMENSPVDYLITGGNYDFLLLNLVGHLTEGKKLEPGIWYRKKSSGKTARDNFASTGNFQLNHDINKLPFIDRDLTKWKLYAYENDNYLRTPGTYIMAGRDCWWRREGGCTFCSWTVLYPRYLLRTPKNVLDEIGELIEKYQVREIMDDTGTFPAGEWLRQFCQGMIARGYNKKVFFNVNLRFGALKGDDYRLMAKAGFRFLLYGLESASQATVDRLNKGTKVEDIEKELLAAKRANEKVGGHLEPHVTCMVGYPWETKKEAQRTIDFTRRLFERGLIQTLQATVVIPYPGTTLFQECQKNHWLKTTDWNRFDMGEPVMKTPMSDQEVMKLVRSIYDSFWSPSFILRKLKEGLTNFDKFKYYTWLGLKYFSRKIDFGHRSGASAYFWLAGRVLFSRLAYFRRI